MDKIAESFVPVTEENKSLLEFFLSDAGSSLDSFRYFARRPLSVIKNHLVTVLLMKGDIPVGYGHLDCEAGVVWLGIAVKHDHIGFGYGNRIMEFLIAEARKNSLPFIQLTVDTDNEKAIHLYKKFGFMQINASGSSPKLMKLDLDTLE